MGLSKAQRLLLINQHRILALLKPEEADEHERLIEALSKGYTGIYKQILGELQDEIPLEICREVHSILGLYETINSFVQETPGCGIEPWEIEFPGFDRFQFYSGDEVYHYRYASYLVGLGRSKVYSCDLPELRFISKVPISDVPTLRAYARMKEQITMYPVTLEMVRGALKHRPHKLTPEEAIEMYPCRFGVMSGFTPEQLFAKYPDRFLPPTPPNPSETRTAALLRRAKSLLDFSH